MQTGGCKSLALHVAVPKQRRHGADIRLPTSAWRRRWRRVVRANWLAIRAVHATYETTDHMTANADHVARCLLHHRRRNVRATRIHIQHPRTRDDDEVHVLHGDRPKQTCVPSTSAPVKLTRFLNRTSIAPHTEPVVAYRPPAALPFDRSRRAPVGSARAPEYTDAPTRSRQVHPLQSAATPAFSDFSD